MLPCHPGGMVWLRGLVKRSVLFPIATRCQATLSKEQCLGVRARCGSIYAYIFMYICAYVYRSKNDDQVND